jgi:glycosyltransferase involved in cell wall biosynthesis
MPQISPVTVVIPTYRRPALLAGALRSVLAQTFRDFSVLVSDDDASDEVSELVSAIGDPRVRYQANTPRLGQGLNPLLPMGQAQTPLVACLQDDDEWEPSLLATLVPPLLDDPDIVVAFSDHHLMDAEGRLQSRETTRASRHWGRAGLARGKHQPCFELGVVSQSIPAMMTAVVRREAVEWELPSEIGTVSDLWLGYLVTRGGGAAWYEPARLGRYRSHEASATARSGSVQTSSILYCYDRFLADPALASVWPKLRRRRDSIAVELGLDHLREGRWQAGRRILARSLGRRPSPRAAAGVVLSVAPRPIARAALRTRRPG